MGLFSKKKSDKNRLSMPADLPKLPDLSDVNDLISQKLPTLPTDKFGEKFSRNNIKQAVSGEKEVEEEEDNDEESSFRDFKKKFEKETVSSPNEEDDSKNLGGFNPSTKVKESSPKVSSSFVSEGKVGIPKEGPIFVHIEEFNEAIRKFKNTRKDLLEVEEVLSKIKEIRVEESEELKKWEEKIKRTKEQIEVINKNIFSKVNF